MKDQKPIVSYIKNGIERTVTLNIFNYKKVFSDIFSDRLCSFGENTVKNISWIHVQEEVQWLYFKNFHFEDVFQFECFDDTLWIFDQCTFSLGFLKKIQFFWGTFLLMDVEFQGINTLVSNAKELEFRFSSNSELDYSEANASTSFGNVLETVIANRIALKIKDHGVIFNDVISGKNVIIGNEKRYSLFPVDNCYAYLKIRADELHFTHILFKDMEMKNRDGCNHYIDIDFNQLFIDHFMLKTIGDVNINGIQLFPKKENDFIILNDDDFYLLDARAKIVSLLKGMQLLVEKKKNVYVQNYLEDEQSKIKMLEQELDKMKKNIKVKERKIHESFSKKNIRYFN